MAVEVVISVVPFVSKPLSSPSVLDRILCKHVAFLAAGITCADIHIEIRDEHGELVAVGDSFVRYARDGTVEGVGAGPGASRCRHPATTSKANSSRARLVMAQR